MLRGTQYAWHMIAIVFIVLFREFMVSSLRLVTVSSGGKVVAANMWGKAKTVSQMVGLVLALFAYVLIGDFGMTGIAEVMNLIIIALFWLSAVLCVISGLIYLAACKEFIDPNK